MDKEARRILLRRVLLAAALVIAALIYYFSDQDGNQSAELSGGATRFLLHAFVPGYDSLPQSQQLAYMSSLAFYVRKAAHFSEYALLAAMLEGYLYLRLPSGSLRLSGLGAWLIATAYAGTDEVHQMFVADRGPSLAEVGIDSAGALFAVLIVAAALAARRRRKRKEK